MATITREASLRARGAGHDRVLALDRFRGIAVLLMVLNHWGLAVYGGTPPGRDTLEGFLIFAGSFAPAAFFFATGFGIGLRRGPCDAGGTARKALLLFLCDAFLWLRAGHVIGIDFLGFTAITICTVEAVRCSRSPIRIALSLAVLSLVGRFLVGPRLPEDAFALRALLGTHPVESVSYGLLPWICFPLIGFVSARMNGSEWARRALSDTGALASALLAGALVMTGAPVFRWGTMSVAFFLAAWPFLSILWRAAGSRRSRGLAIAGPACLAIVPLHYAGIDLLAPLVSGGSPGAISLAIGAIGITVLCLTLAPRLVSSLAAVPGWAGIGVAGAALFAASNAILAPAMASLPGSLAVVGILGPRRTHESAGPSAATNRSS